MYWLAPLLNKSDVQVVDITTLERRQGEGENENCGIDPRLQLTHVATLNGTILKAAPPPALTDPVNDTYHGVTVTDDYRWLEDGYNPAVVAWSDSQNNYARSVLDNLPDVDSIRSRVAEILLAESASFSSVVFRNGVYFAAKYQPPKEQPLLVAFNSIDHPEDARTIFAPSNYDETGTTSVDWFEPSPNGSLIAVSVSKGGSEIGDVLVFETGSGKQVFETVPLVNSGIAGGDLAWDSDGRGFYYTRHFWPSDEQGKNLSFYQQLYYHKLGEDVKNDRYELGEDLPKIAEIEIKVHEPTGKVLCLVQNGDGGEFAHYLRLPNGTWKQFSEFGDKTVQAAFEPSGNLLTITREGAPRGKIMRLKDVGESTESASLLIAESNDTIATSFFNAPPSMVATENRIYATYQLGGPSEIRVFDLDGKLLGKLQPLEYSSVGGMTRLTGDDILFHSSSFVAPTSWYHVKVSEDAVAKTKISSASPVDFHDVIVSREFAISKDGTKIPVNILRSQNVKGPGPLVLTGYGGYGINMTPQYNTANKVLLEQGVTYVVANIRGGGEYGEQWHLSGNLTDKQNVFDDFCAAAKYLIDNGYTTPDKLAISGRSNGGLLMGTLMTQHPDLMKCVVSHVGFYDMLRVELSPNGRYNIPEFGSVQNEEEFKALYAYSPYHKVKQDAVYPSTLFLTGANDPRVDPMNSRKMTARLQAVNSSKSPILLRTSANTGHGHAGTALSLQIEEIVDVDAFLFHQLGVDYKQSNSRDSVVHPAHQDAHKLHKKPSGVRNR